MMEERRDHANLLPKSDPQSEEDLDTWYQNVEMKLGAIPDSSDRYTPTCEAIHQVQDLFQEVVDKQLKASHRSDLSFSFDSLLHPLSAKQETLFTALVQFHQIKLSALEPVVQEAEGKIEKQITSRQQREVHKLNEYRTKLKECERDLQDLIEAPQPLKVQPLSKAEQEQHDQGTVYSQLAALHNKAELLLLRCQELVEKFDSKMHQLESELSTKNDRFLRELDEVEEWLNTAYHLLRQEPSRVIEGAYSLDDGGEQMAFDNDRDILQTPESVSPYLDDEDKEYAVNFESSTDIVEEDDKETSGESSIKKEITVESDKRFNEELEEGSQEGVQSGVEELSSEEDKFGLHWIRELQLLPMEHDPAIDENQGEVPQQQPSTESDIYHLLDQLENMLSQLPIQSQKLKSTTANISFVINTVSMETGKQLKDRLQSVKHRWENLSNKLKLRRAQLTFEKAQQEILESALETIQELDEQPQSNLLPGEMEHKKTMLMDFLISVDQFDSQKTEQLTNLDESLNDLEGVWPEEEGLQEWQDTVEQLRAAYEAISVKVKEQVTFLESCLSQWSNFSRQCERFEEWLTRNEEMVSRDSYGHTLQECEVYYSALKEIKARMEEKELVFSEIEKLGNTMLEDMEEHSKPEQFMDDKLSTLEQRWSELKRRLEYQLEMSSGDVPAFMESLQNLYDWLNKKLEQESLTAKPVAQLEQLKVYSNALQVTLEELVERQRVRESLESSAVTLKTQVAGPNASRLDERLSEVAELWERLGREIESRREVLDPLISRVESLGSRFTDFDTWLTEQEKILNECGPIGAHLQRLEEQAEILELQDGALLEKKRVPEDLNKELMNIIEQTLEGSGSDIQNRYGDLESWFMELCQQSVERRELCEEALSAMQDFQKKVDKFTLWLEEMERSLADKRAEKKPVGSIQTELEEFYDFMSDIEKHTDDYLDLRPEATKLSNTYKPSDVLDNMMSSLHNRWSIYVDGLNGRCNELLALADLWRRYETEVKELLNWVSTEAEDFSKEVTTEGDKGIEDHIESCRLFADTLEAKRHAILEVEDLANILRAEDGAKKNGTSDVESRWNDVNQHWNSLCKLLAETLLRLEATYAEVRHVIQIRKEEFDWLVECEHRGNSYRPTRGNMDAIQEEIEEHEQLLEEITNHQEEAEFVRKTVPFLVEHSRKQVREEMKQTANDFIRRYEALKGSQDSYIHNLQDSIPHWRQFNEEVCELQQWVEQVNRDLESDKFQPGNATLTETSLANARRLLEEISVQSDAVQVATSTSKALAKLVISSDLEYVSGIVEELRVGTEHISEEIEERTVELEERLKSWQVFPVEEARVVQALLDQVESEVAGEKTQEEEMTSDQLLEKLKRLEALQEMQSSNEDKMSSIDQSADSEDVKKALEKNPDISKERGNLLQGWSSMSSSLKEKIAVMKRKAKMVQEIEQSLSECENALKVYRTHLDVPLPPSVVLAGIDKEMNKESVTLHNRCQSSLSNQKNLFDRYSGDPDLLVPIHLTERAQCCDEEFQKLSVRAEQRTNQITEITESWLKFEWGMKRFTSWLRTSNSELSGLRVVENFVLEFSSLEDRLQTLTDEVSDKERDFDALRSASLQPCSGEGQDVQQVKQMFTKVEQAWCSLKEGVKTLPVTIKPWQELTDQFEQLSNWFDLLEHRVRQDKAAIEERDDVDGNVSDLVVAFKGHLDKLSQQEPELQELQDRVNDLLTEEACGKFESSVGALQKQYETLDRKWEELREQLNQTLSQLEMKSEQWSTQAVWNRTLVTELQLELAASHETARQREHTISQLEEKLKKNEEQRIQQYHHRSWLRRGLIHDGLVGVGFIGVSLFLYFIGFRRFRHARL